MPQPTTVTANFTVPANSSSGGRLQGGFGASNQLNGGDTLQVAVTWGGNNNPTQLTGYFIISPTSTSSQTAPSPFINGGLYVCYLALTASQSNQNYTFTSPLLVVPSGTAAGSFELTLVIQDSTGAQWSEDPEFDTTGD